MAQTAKNGANLRLLASVLNEASVSTRTSKKKGHARIHARSFVAVGTKGPGRWDAGVHRLTPKITHARQLSSTPTLGDANASTASSSSSVNATEVSHFSSLASSWWDPHGPSRILHLMNPLRHDFISECLSSSSNTADRHSRKDTYLDIGCGGGIFAESAARLPHTSSVVAIDPTTSILSVAREHARNDPTLSPPKLTYLNSSIEELSSHLPNVPISDDKKFDIVTLFEVLEHVHSPSTFLRHCTSHLAPGGWLIMSTISRTPISFFVTKMIAEFPVLGPVPPGTHTWSKYISPQELREWFEKDEDKGNTRWGVPVVRGVAYVPGFGWQWVPKAFGMDGVGNYFFGIQKLEDSRI